MLLNLQCLVQGKGALDSSNNGLNRRFSQAERLSRVSEELAWYCKSAGSDSHGTTLLSLSCEHWEVVRREEACNSIDS
ncbi:hypothetical protein Ahy_A10g050423 isoform B [Arachis hypogaea]|uniref:Uncharacterized protein n=1 Tax=Arachis hypogaea TaxID=3818 RepID=A0A445B9C3_ARAHY|nr:hypothetical protein Ahy_A10g050423 isoform B [Arachis hypogaea]